MLGSDKPLAWLHGEIKTPRIQDADLTWRVIYRVDPDVVIICDVFAKKTQATPRSVIESCRRRLTVYDAIASGKR
jgi:phage-related protein